MFDFLKSASCAPQIGLGTGLNVTGQAIISVGNMVAGAGANMQASGWARRLGYKGIVVGLRIADDTVDETVNSVTALMMHFSNPMNLLQFRATNPQANDLAAKYQAEFDARSKAAYEAEGLLFPVTQPVQSQQQSQPKTQAAAQPQQQSLSQMISELTDDELELAGCC